MMTAKEKILELIEEIPDPDVEEVLYFLERIKDKQRVASINKKTFKSGEINIDYWDSDIDDEVWKEI